MAFACENFMVFLYHEFISLPLSGKSLFRVSPWWVIFMSWDCPARFVGLTSGFIPVYSYLLYYYLFLFSLWTGLWEANEEFLPSHWGNAGSFMGLWTRLYEQCWSNKTNMNSPCHLLTVLMYWLSTETSWPLTLSAEETAVKWGWIFAQSWPSFLSSLGCTRWCSRAMFPSLH